MSFNSFDGCFWHWQLACLKGCYKKYILNLCKCVRVCVCECCLFFSVFDCLLLICICVLVSCVCVWVCVCLSLRCFCCCCCHWLNPFFTLAHMNECGNHTLTHTHTHWGILIPFGVLCIDPSNSPTCCQRQRLLPSSVYYYSCCCCCCCCLVCLCVCVYWLLCQLFGGFCLPVNPPNNLPLHSPFHPFPRCLVSSLAAWQFC